jgi:hypothetical protein
MSITNNINTTALRLLEENPDGIRWSEMLRLLQKAGPDWHPKTINGCVWKLVEKYPDQVYKPEKGLFRLKRN